MPKRTEPEVLWEQQPGESAKAFEAFAAYRDMGAERSLRKLTQQLHKNLTTIRDWSVKWNWQERVRAYDRELDRQAREQAVRSVRQMTDRHIRIAMQLQAKAVRALENLDEAQLTPKMMLAFLTKATELERMNRLSNAGLDENGQKEAASEVEIIIEGDDDVDDQS
ncbi:MAG: hypothetical protein IJV91_02910 [Kiritimatiellae bacterium]|nr:hypothetical protein [Kiritimatiellia bacterium]